MATMILHTLVFVAVFLISMSSSSHHEEDFAFDQDVIPQSEIARLSSRTPLRRQFGIPDAMAYLGRLFFFKIPLDAFSGTLSHYKVSGMPSWMIFNEGEGLFEGVPGDKDVGETYITVIAIGPTAEDSVKDIFVVEVSPDPREYSSDIKERCKSGQDATTITVVLDKDFYSIKPSDKILAIKNLAGFLSFNYEKFSLLPQNSEDDILSENVINAGPGNVKKKSSLTSTSLQWQVGCGGSVWSMHGITHVKQIAKDGTLAEVIQLPVIGWHLATSPFPFRARRELVGSGEGEEREVKEDETENADDDEEEEEPEKRVTVPMRSPTPVLPAHMKTSSAPDAHHPLRHAHAHNHHHDTEEGADEEGDEGLSGKLQLNTTSGDPVVSLNILPTPTLVPERPAPKATEYPSYSSQITPEQVTRFYTTETSAVPDSFTLSPEYTDGETEPLGENELQTSTTYTMDNSSSTVTPFLSNTPTDVTKAIDYTKETDVEEPKNFPPRISERLPQLAVTAGKLLMHTIPDNTFSDLEDGNTKELTIDFLTNEKTHLERSSWIQFNPQSLTIYALPLEEHVSKWYFTIKATDSEGESVTDEVVVAVQNHRQQRTITHEITIHFQPWLDNVEQMLPLDVHILILNRLAKVYNNTDSSHITVLSMNATSFSWTNDSLSRISPCPRQEIQNLINVLSEGEDKPRSVVKSTFLPELDVLRVTWEGRGQCQRTDKGVGVPEPPPQTVNFPPTRRNSIDLLNATVGELLVYTVPGDSYYDHEDGSVRNLKLTLLTMNRSAIPFSHWLQFDVKNQEFYGIPNPNDTGRTQYQLVCEDSGGLSFNDGLIVEVHPARKILYNVEFSMTLGIHYDNFVMNPASQRHFFEKLAELFGDKDTSAIVRSGMAPGSTIITWHNRTLPTNTCPNDQIKVLRQVLLGDDERVSMRAKTIMGPELNVVTASLTPTRLCEGASTPVHIAQPPLVPPDEVRPVSRSDEYLVTVVVPAVVIATMLICAALVACVLYRRRRQGKMSVGDEDERQSFRSKGIPVIFQDELEERPEPTNKSPVIMKEEKPPLPPPEYQRNHPAPTAATALLSDTEDSPYQPPPPFTSSRDSARPKPTPTYRMPPPYVPP